MATRTKASPLSDEQIAAFSPAERTKLVQAEREALANRVAGKPRPSTPVSDWLMAHPEQVRTRKVGTARGVYPPEPATHAYWIGAVGSSTADRLVAVTQHSLSYMAGYTKTSSEPRIPTSELSKVVFDQNPGVTSIESEEWTVILPQTGRVVAHRLIPKDTPRGTEGVAPSTAPEMAKPKVTKPRTRTTKKAAA